MPEGLALRRELGPVRILVMGPATSREIADARDAGLELVIADGEVPEGVRVHLKLDTGMGRWGLAELPAPGREVVGLMSHFASADSDAAFTELQIERFRGRDRRALVADAPHRQQRRGAPLSDGALRRGALRDRPLRDLAVRHGSRPRTGSSRRFAGSRSWRRCVRLQPGDSTGYGRRWIAERPTWIGIVPVGYADGFRRDLTGTEVRVAGEPRRVVGTVSMDAFAVELDRELPVGTPVVLLGHGVQAEAHARTAGTIGYEIVTGIRSSPDRTRRSVVDC